MGAILTGRVDEHHPPHFGFPIGSLEFVREGATS